MVSIFRVLAVLFLAAAVPLSASAAASKIIKVTPLQGAEIAIGYNRCDEAEKILALALKQDPKSTEALFLMGECYSQQKKWAASLPFFRKILADHPGLVRVRLDLARAEFETDDDEGADYNFRLALSENDLPDTVVDNIGHYLAAIQARKRFTYNVNLSVAPDSNINAATSNANVTLFGLPFQLNENSTQKSGVGIVTTASGEAFTAIDAGLRVRTGGSYWGEFFPGHSQYDYIVTRAQIGPQWMFKNGDASVLAVVGKQWYGLDPYDESVGGRIEGDYALTKRLQLYSYFEGLSDSYHSLQYYNGYNFDQQNYLTYYFNPRTLVRVIAGGGYQSATQAFEGLDYGDANEYWYWDAGFGVQFQFPWGITAYAEPDAKLSYYLGPDPFFGIRRRDRLYSAKISLYKRDWEIFGFSPVATVSYARNVTNDPIYRFHRVQFQLGFTKQF